VLVEAAFVFEKQFQRLLDNPNDLAARLRGRQPPFFDSSGDRRGGRGEYIVVLRPKFASGAPVLTEAMLEIWTRDDVESTSKWKRIKDLVIEHGRQAAY